MIFWGGVVFLGFIFPVVLENIASFFPGSFLLVSAAGLLLLCGGFFLRLGILHAGIKDQIPMHRLMEIQHGILAGKANAFPGRRMNVPGGIGD